MAKLGQLVIELAANSALLQSDMGKAVSIVERGAAGMRRAFSFLGGGAGGGLIATAFVSATRDAIKFGDELQKAAIKAGVGGKTISELAYAAKLADVDLSSLSTAIKKMQVSLSEAGTGAKGPTQALAALGLSIEQIQSYKPDEQFQILADRISRLKDPADRARAAVELFGRAGADLLPLFAQGAAGIIKAREEAERLGISLGDEQIKKLAEADEKLKKFDASWNAFKTKMVSEYAPGISQALDDITSGKTGERAKRTAISPLLGLISRGAEFFEDPATPRNIGRRGGDPSSTAINSPLGYAEMMKAEEAAAKKAAAAVQQYAKDTAAVVVQSTHISVDAITALYDSWEESALSAYDRELSAFYGRVANLDALAEAGRISAEQYGRAFTEALDDVLGEVKVTVKKVAIESEQAWTGAAGVFKDVWSQAVEDVFNGTKLQWDEFAQLQMDKLFDSMFSGGSGGGFWSQLLGGLAGGSGGTYSPDGTFFPGRASGGPVSAGKSYVVGERGMEVFRPGVSGHIESNASLRGGGAISVTNNFVLNGVGPDLMKVLPEMAKRISESTKADIADGLRRGRYVVNG